MDTVLAWLATIAVSIPTAIAAFGPARAVCMRGEVKDFRGSIGGFSIFVLIALVFLSAALVDGLVPTWIPVMFAAMGLVGGVVAGWDAARLERRQSPDE